MIRTAMLSLPWGRLGAAAVLVGILMEGVRRWPWSVWPLEGIAVGLLAAAVAWCLDEPAGAVADAAPRPLWWRTVARLPGIAGLVGVWTVAVWSARHSLFGHPWDVWTQGLTCSAVAVAWATWRRSMGVRNPGIAFAVVVVPVAALWALMRPFQETLPVFPYADDDWTTSTSGWIGVGVAALAGLTLVLSDSRWWRAGRLPVRRKPPPDQEWDTPRKNAVLVLEPKSRTRSTKHSDATSARVELRRCEDCLAIDISDNGNAGGEWVPGIGLTSMKERASELGGTVTYRGTPTGSSVTAQLPLGTSRGTDAHAG